MPHELIPKSSGSVHFLLASERKSTDDDDDYQDNQTANKWMVNGNNQLVSSYKTNSTRERLSSFPWVCIEALEKAHK